MLQCTIADNNVSPSVCVIITTHSHYSFTLTTHTPSLLTHTLTTHHSLLNHTLIMQSHPHYILTHTLTTLTPSLLSHTLTTLTPSLLSHPHYSHPHYSHTFTTHTPSLFTHPHYSFTPSLLTHPHYSHTLTTHTPSLLSQTLTHTTVPLLPTNCHIRFLWTTPNGSRVQGTAPAGRPGHVCRGHESHLSSSFFILYGRGDVQVSCVALL